MKNEFLKNLNAIVKYWRFLFVWGGMIRRLGVEFAGDGQDLLKGRRKWNGRAWGRPMGPPHEAAEWLPRNFLVSGDLLPVEILVLCHHSVHEFLSWALLLSPPQFFNEWAGLQPFHNTANKKKKTGKRGKAGWKELVERIKGKFQHRCCGYTWKSGC